MSWPATRAALRIARRDALRAKGRSALVVAMIGLPMLAMAFADIGVRTGQLPPATSATRELGTADLRVTTPPFGAKATTVAAITTRLPSGSRVVERTVDFRVHVDAGDAAVVADLEHFDLADVLARGVVQIRDGAFPATDAEVAVTTRVARTLRLHVGDAVRLGQPPRTFRVSGIVRDPSRLRARTAYVRPTAHVDVPKAGEFQLVLNQFSVDLPPGVRDVDVEPSLTAAGYDVTPRTWFFHPPPRPNDTSASAIGVVVVVVGLAALEVVLLAGTAFAVGARRRQRDLALVAATGGDRKDVRRIVLAGGVVLGAVAGLAGITGGILLFVAGRPLLERLGGSLMGPLDLRPLELGAIVVVAIGTALLAAVLPARQAARQSVVAALTGRRGQGSPSRRVPILALVAVGAGTALAFWAAGEGPGRHANFLLVLVGAVVAELGFVACAPGLVSLVGRLGGRLPLALRLATRDAARHRTRSGPAVAAVVAAVAGSVAVSVYLSSDTERQRRAYLPRLPAGVVEVIHKGSSGTPDLTGVVTALPVKERIDAGALGTFCLPGAACDDYRIVLPGSATCTERTHCIRPDDRALAVGTAALVTVFSGHADPAVAAALRAGSIVVFDRQWVENGHVTLQHVRYGPGELVKPGVIEAKESVLRERVTLPAVVVTAPSYAGAPSAVLTAETARARHLPWVPVESVFTTTRMPTQREEARATAATDTAGVPYQVYVERGFVRTNEIALLVLLGASALVTVGSTGIATGLAAADSRPDLATLAAVGAPPRVRRRLAMAQAATVAALGSALGILAGVVSSATIVAARPSMPLAVPYGLLALTAVGVPLVAALLVGLVTRSRLPLSQRVA